jgi:hypothetical protein
VQAGLDRRVMYVQGISSLVGRIGSPTDSVNVLSWHVGLNRGGGIFNWVSDLPRSNHDGGLVISPTVPFGDVMSFWDGAAVDTIGTSAIDLVDYLDGTGDTDPSANGCWVRSVVGSVTPYMWGAKARPFADAEPFDKCINNPTYRDVSFPVEFFLERTVDIRVAKTNFSGNRTGPSPFLDSQTVGLNVNIDTPAVTSQLNFSNVFFSGRSVANIACANFIAIRAIDFPLIDSTMDKCWFNLGTNITSGIVGRFFYLKISNSIFEESGKGIVTSGGTRSDSLQLSNCAFFRMANCCLDFGDDVQEKINFTISNIQFGGGGTVTSQFIRGVDLECELSNISIKQADDNTFTNANFLDFFESDIQINNLKCYNQAGERPADNLVRSWILSRYSNMQISNSALNDAGTVCVDLHGSGYFSASNVTLRGARQSLVRFDSTADDLIVKFDGCRFLRPRERAFLYLSSNPNVHVKCTDTHFEGMGFGLGSAITAIEMNAAHTPELIDCTYRKVTGDEVAYWVRADRPAFVNGYTLLGSAPLYNTGAVDYNVFSFYGSANRGAGYRDVGDAAPTAGDWGRGAIRYRRNATAGSFIGWICTVSGTPGTWKEFGDIEA